MPASLRAILYLDSGEVERLTVPSMPGGAIRPEKVPISLHM